MPSFIVIVKFLSQIPGWKRLKNIIFYLMQRIWQHKFSNSIMCNAQHSTTIATCVWRHEATTPSIHTCAARNKVHDIWCKAVVFATADVITHHVITQPHDSQLPAASGCTGSAARPSVILSVSLTHTCSHAHMGHRISVAMCLLARSLSFLATA